MVFVMVFAALCCFACALQIGRNAEIAERDRISNVEKSYGLIFADDTLEDNQKTSAVNPRDAGSAYSDGNFQKQPNTAIN